MRLTTRQTCVDGKGSDGRKQVVRMRSKVKDRRCLSNVIAGVSLQNQSYG